MNMRNREICALLNLTKKDLNGLFVHQLDSEETAIMQFYYEVRLIQLKHGVLNRIVDDKTFQNKLGALGLTVISGEKPVSDSTSRRGSCAETLELVRIDDSGNIRRDDRGFTFQVASSQDLRKNKVRTEMNSEVPRKKRQHHEVQAIPNYNFNVQDNPYNDYKRFNSFNDGVTFVALDTAPETFTTIQINAAFEQQDLPNPKKRKTDSTVNDIPMVQQPQVMNIACNTLNQPVATTLDDCNSLFNQDADFFSLDQFTLLEDISFTDQYISEAQCQVSTASNNEIQSAENGHLASQAMYYSQQTYYNQSTTNVTQQNPILSQPQQHGEANQECLSQPRVQEKTPLHQFNWLSEQRQHQSVTMTTDHGDDFDLLNGSTLSNNDNGDNLPNENECNMM